jgi:hypothetical protein
MKKEKRKIKLFVLVELTSRNKRFSSPNICIATTWWTICPGWYAGRDKRLDLLSRLRCLVAQPRQKPLADWDNWPILH